MMSGGGNKMYSRDDIIVRAIGGGIWFWMSLFLAGSFFLYIARKRGETPTVVLQIAFFHGIFCLGSAMRAALTWGQFLSALEKLDPAPWLQTWPWFGSSVILNIIGAGGAIFLLTPYRWRWEITLGAVTVAIGVPAVLYMLVRD
jgi:hypothetical protein